MTLNLITDEAPGFSFHYRELAGKIIESALQHEHFPYPAEVNLSLVNSEQMYELNLQERGIDRPTDVLSFPLVDYEAPADYSLLEENKIFYLNPDTCEVPLGDIVLSIDHVRSQAAEYGHSEKREYAFLIVHSMLHLLGYDHMEEEERALMQAREKEILKELRIGR